MRRSILIATAAASAAVAAAALGPSAVGARADTYPGGVDGCIAVAAAAPAVPNPGGPTGSGNVVNSNTCRFTARQDGGFAAAGTNWSVAVYDRADPGTRRLLAQYTTANRNGKPYIQQGGVGTVPQSTPTPCRFPAYRAHQFIVVTTADGPVYAGTTKPPAGTAPVDVPALSFSCQWGENTNSP
jgi:hypothetical protein